MRSPLHSARTPRTSAAGTVSSPSLVNSPPTFTPPAAGKWLSLLDLAKEWRPHRVFRDVGEHARTELGVPVRHLLEAEMKKCEQADGRLIPDGSLELDH